MDISYCDDKTGFPRPGHIFLFIEYAIITYKFCVHHIEDKMNNMLCTDHTAQYVGSSST